MFRWLKSKSDLIGQIKELESRLSKVEYEKALAIADIIEAQANKEKAEERVASAIELASYFLETTRYLRDSNYDQNRLIEYFTENNVVFKRIKSGRRHETEYHFIQMSNIFTTILDLFNSGLTKDNIEKWWNLRNENARLYNDKEMWRNNAMAGADRSEILLSEKGTLEDKLLKEQNRIDLIAKLMINNMQYEAILVNNEGSGPQVELHIENQKPIRCRLVDIEQIKGE